MWDDSFKFNAIKFVSGSQMFIFEPVFNWVLKYRKSYQHIKACTCWGMKVLEDFQMGYENFKGNLDGL